MWNKKYIYPYPSRYGSHSSMVISELPDNMVVCEDEYGTYETTVDRLDNNLADPNRYENRDDN